MLIPEERDGHYKAVRRGIEEADLTAPNLSISNGAGSRNLGIRLLSPNPASIETLERRLNRKY
jgi:hypothetical protein